MHVSTQARRLNRNRPEQEIVRQPYFEEELLLQTYGIARIHTRKRVEQKGSGSNARWAAGSIRLKRGKSGIQQDQALNRVHVDWVM